MLILKLFLHRASRHFEDVVWFLLDASPVRHMSAQWHPIVVSLVREVVAKVDPDVRRNDSLDIRPYVKIEVIPGAPLQLCYTTKLIFFLLSHS